MANRVPSGYIKARPADMENAALWRITHRAIAGVIAFMDRHDELCTRAACIGERGGDDTCRFP